MMSRRKQARPSRHLEQNEEEGKSSGPAVPRIEDDRHAEDANNNQSKSREGSVDKDEADQQDLESVKESLTTAIRNLLGNFPLPSAATAAAAAATGGPSVNLTLEALQNTKVAVAQFAANALNATSDENNDNCNSPSLQDLAVLQSTLFTLQQQQLLQLQLIQQLQQQLHVSNDGNDKGSTSRENSVSPTYQLQRATTGSPAPAQHTLPHTNQNSSKSTHNNSGNIIKSSLSQKSSNGNHASSVSSLNQPNPHHHHNSSKFLKSLQTKSNSLLGSRSSIKRAGSPIDPQSSSSSKSISNNNNPSSGNSSGNINSSSSNNNDNVGDSTHHSTKIPSSSSSNALMKSNPPSSTSLAGQPTNNNIASESTSPLGLNPHFASLLNCANLDPNRPLSPGLGLSSMPSTTSQSDHLLGSEHEEPNTLEMLQKRAQEVLDSASQGLLASSLNDDSKYRKASGTGAFEKNKDPFFKHRCRYCGKVFGSDSALQIHIRSHTGERPFKCNVCGSRFTTKGNLKVHFQRHAAKFPHVKMNPHPVPEHLDHLHPPLLASGQTTPEHSPTGGITAHIPPSNNHNNNNNTNNTNPISHNNNHNNNTTPFPTHIPPHSFNPFGSLLRFDLSSVGQSMNVNHTGINNSNIGGSLLMPANTHLHLSTSAPQDLTKPKLKIKNENDMDDDDDNDDDKFGDNEDDKQSEHQSSSDPIKQEVDDSPNDNDERRNDQDETVMEEDDDEDNYEKILDDSIEEDDTNEKECNDILTKDGMEIQQDIIENQDDHQSLYSDQDEDEKRNNISLTNELLDDDSILADDSSQDQPENLSSKSAPLMYPLPYKQQRIPGRPASTYGRASSPLRLDNFKDRISPASCGEMDPTKDPAIYTNLLPRPGSNDNAWETLIEITKTSETTKLQQLVDNIEHKLTDPNQCVICHRVLSCKSALQMHYRTHTGERPFKCKICGRAFTTKGNLKTHMGVHRAKPPLRVLHQCPVCHKRFTNSLVLQQHIRLHTGEPTDLTPDQIRAAEVKDPFPSFPAFPPYGSPVPPHFLPHNALMGLHSMKSGNASSEDERSVSSLRRHNMKNDEDDSNDDDSFKDDRDDDNYEEIQKLSSGSENGTPHKLLTESQIKKLIEEAGGNDSDSHCSGGPKDLSAFERHKDFLPEVSRNTQINNGIVSPATSFDADNQSDISSEPKNVGDGDREASAPSPISSSNQQSPVSSVNNETATPPSFGALDLTPKGSTSTAGMHQPGTPHGHIFPPFAPVHPPHPGLMHSGLLNSPNALTSLANSVLTSTSFSPVLVPPTPPGVRQDADENQCFMWAARGNTTCHICLKTFACNSALEIHYRSHTKERPFKCTVCDRGFSTKGNMKQHMLTHKIRDMPESKTNGVISEGNSNSMSSMSSQPADEEMQEPLVRESRSPSPSSIPSKRSPSIGAEERSSPNQPPAPKKSNSSLPSCDSGDDGSCSEPGFSSNSSNNTKHLCKACSKSFSSSSALNIHMRTHTGDRPFKCSVCQKAFTTKGNLKVHMGTHMWTNGASRRGRRMSLELPLGLQFLPPPPGMMKGPRESMPPRPDLFYPYSAATAPIFLNGSHNPPGKFPGLRYPFGPEEERQLTQDENSGIDEDAGYSSRKKLDKAEDLKQEKPVNLLGEKVMTSEKLNRSEPSQQ